MNELSLPLDEGPALMHGSKNRLALYMCKGIMHAINVFFTCETNAIPSRYFHFDSLPTYLQ